MGQYDQLVRKVLNDTVEPLLERKLVLEDLGTSEYEGEVTGKDGGDTVTVVYGTDIVLRTYTNGAQLTYDKPSPTTHDIVVDTGKYFVYNLSTVEEKQMGTKRAGAVMKDLTHRAAYQFAKSIDDDIAELYTSAGMVIDNSGHYTNGGADISNASALSITSSNAFKFMSDMSVLFDESDVQEEDRFAVLPPWICARLLLDDRNVFTNKQVGQQNKGKISTPVHGFNVVKSNSVKSSGGTYYPLFGIKKKSFACIRQINPKAMDASRPDYFESATKMVLLYGVDCHRSDLFGTAAISIGTE